METVIRCNLELNKARCPCTHRPCPRAGKCCECVKHHLENQELPGCVFPPEVERTWDRSFTKFAEVVNAMKKA